MNTPAKTLDEQWAAEQAQQMKPVSEKQANQKWLNEHARMDALHQKNDKENGQ